MQRSGISGTPELTLLRAPRTPLLRHGHHRTHPTGALTPRTPQPRRGRTTLTHTKSADPTLPQLLRSPSRPPPSPSPLATPISVLISAGHTPDVAPLSWCRSPNAPAQRRHRRALLRRALLRALNAQHARAWHKWTGVVVEQRRKKARSDWCRLGAALFKRTSVGRMLELVRRWKVLRRVVLRIASAKTAAGWSKWTMVMSSARTEEARRAWRAFGAQLYQKSVARASEMVRRWRLLRRTVLRALHLRHARAWRQWSTVVEEQRQHGAHVRWRALGEMVYKTTSVGRMVSWECTLGF